MSASKEIERLANEHAIAKAKPMIRSMWPSESRSVMALHFSRSFEAGANAVLPDLRMAMEVLDIVNQCSHKEESKDSSVAVFRIEMDKTKLKEMREAIAKLERWK